MCLSNTFAVLNPFPQLEHWNGFVHLCTLSKWRFSWDLFLNSWLQYKHWTLLLDKQTFICLAKLFLCLITFWHFEHLNWSSKLISAIAAKLVLSLPWHWPRLICLLRAIRLLNICLQPSLVHGSMMCDNLSTSLNETFNLSLYQWKYYLLWISR